MGVSRVKEEKTIEEEAKPKEKLKEVKPVKAKEAVKKSIVRVANTDLDGNKSLYIALTGIKGISYTMSKAICAVAGFDPSIKLNTLDEQNIEKLENVIYNIHKFGLPSWVLNRRKDLETGEDLHLIGSDIDVYTKFDIQRMINLKTWKGFRHMHGLPVRGQRTRSSFRKGRTVGVIRKSVRIAMQKAESKEKKEKK
jgi:small subunit ribosomal protein S13